MDNKKLWESALINIELNVSNANYKTWFRDTSVYEQKEGVVYLSVPNTFVKEWLMQKYHSFILKNLREVSEDVRSLDYTIIKKAPVHKPEPEKPLQNNTELPLNNFYINKKNNLNPRYTFDTFVVGPFNELAYAASQTILKNPGGIYNPLFVYGNTGHGKTHLIQAVGNSLKEHADMSVFYLTSEKFASEYINSVQTNKVNRFKEKYRKYDVLIMDDIQFLSNKEKTQEELFHLFNTLYDNNKQIIFSSDKHPNYIPNLEERLQSRFSQGMIVDIPAPDHESRSAILSAKARMNNLEISPEIIDYLAGAIAGNIRELEGILNTIAMQSSLKQKNLSLSEVKRLVKDNAKPQKTFLPKEVVKLVADYYNIEEDNIYQKTRKKEVIKPRQITMYILREDFNISYPSIGEKLGGRDHTTVLHSCEKIKRDIKENPLLTEEINQIRNMMQ